MLEFSPRMHLLPPPVTNGRNAGAWRAKHVDVQPTRVNREMKERQGRAVPDRGMARVAPEIEE